MRIAPRLSKWEKRAGDGQTRFSFHFFRIPWRFGDRRPVKRLVNEDAALPFSFAIFWDRIDRSGNLEVEMFRTRHIEILGLVVLLVVFNFSVWAQDKQSRDQ